MDPRSGVTQPADDDIERLSGFLTELRAAGYLIGPDKILAAHAVLATLKNRGMLPEDRAKLKTLLAPVVCSSGAMQREFYALFDEWLAREVPATAAKETTEPAGLEPILESVKSRVMTARSRVLIGLAATVLFAFLGIVISALTVGNEPGMLERLAKAQSVKSSDGVEFVNQGPTRSAGYIAFALLRLFWPVLAGMAVLVVAIVLRWRFIWRGQARIILDRQPGLKESIPARLRRGRSRLSLFSRVRHSGWARRFLWLRPGGRQDLDVAETLRWSLNNGGMLTPVNTARQAKPEYLVLIDRLSSRDHQGAWCDALIDRLEEMGVPIVRYDFAGDPRWCFSRRGGGAGLAIGDLRVRHPNHRLFIFGDCRALADPTTGDLVPWAEQLISWPEHALFTPEPRSGWGARERMLISHGFTLTQADPEGLAQFIDSVELAGRKAAAAVHPAVALPEALRSFAFRWNGPDVPPESEARSLLIDLHWYLGVDGYDLFCACAVYPELDWNLTLYMSHVMAASTPASQEAALAKLSRLPWFRQGRLPDWLRLQLLDELGPERERLVREALGRLLLGQTGAHDVRFDLPLVAGNRETIDAIARNVLNELARQEVPMGPLRDPIFVSFMRGRSRNRLAVTLPVRRSFREHRTALRAIATPSRKRAFADTGLGPTIAQQDPSRKGRPFWVYAVVFIYVSLVCLAYAVPIWLTLNPSSLPYLFYLILLAVMGAQMGLIWVPVRFLKRRPIRRRSLWPTLIGSGAFAAMLILCLGLAVFILCTEMGIRGTLVEIFLGYGTLVFAVLTWIFWAGLFYLASFTEGPTSVGLRLHRTLIRGSVLELLVALVAHIVLRRKGECSAGIVSFLGICSGLAVMLVAFGPAVVILYAGRARAKQAIASSEASSKARPLPGKDRFKLPSYRRVAIVLIVLLVAVALWDLAFPATGREDVAHSFLYLLWRLLRYGEVSPLVW